jgi:uncharacterized iron-regulated membrane protein
MIRRFFIWLHRWAGLAMALFLVIVGLTGSLLAFRGEIDAWLNPQLYTVAPREAPMLDPIVLREKAAALYPDVQFDAAPLHLEPDRTVRFGFSPLKTAMSPEQEWQQWSYLFLDPYTGEKRAVRTASELRWDGEPLTRENLLGFIFSLHYQLAVPGEPAGRWGAIFLGIIAIVWTIDCFVSFYLTFPLRLCARGKTSSSSKSWWSRWKPAWLIKLNAGAYRINFDIHRAFGLWTWVMLFILAWSSVELNLRNEVYTPVMALAFDMHYPPNDLPALDKPLEATALGWCEALAHGRALLAEAGARQGFTVVREEQLVLDRDRGVYILYARGSGELGNSENYAAFDANSGELKALSGQRAESAGSFISRWLKSIHMATVFGLPMQILICVMGLVITALSVTGVYIWWKKQRARKFSKAHRGVAAAEVVAE